MRSYLTNKQAVSIQYEILKRRQGNNLNNSSLAELAREELNVSFTPSRPILSRLSTRDNDTTTNAYNGSYIYCGPTQEDIEARLL